MILPYSSYPAWNGAGIERKGFDMQVQENSKAESDMLTLELLHMKSEKLRKALWGNHASVCNKVACAEEKLEWLVDRLAKLECIIEGR